MSAQVFDCSFTAALFLPDEHSDSVAKYFKAIPDGEEILVPQLWWYEISSVLSVATRRGRLKHSEVAAILHLLKGYGFETDLSYGEKYAEQLFELSQLYQLSSYDAAYLELAIRKNATLATLDEKLAMACDRAGVSLAATKGNDDAST